MKTIRIPDDLHQKIKIICSLREMNITEFITEGIHIVLDKYEADITTVASDGRIIIKEYINKNT